MNKNILLGFEFTSCFVTPIIIFILGGLYIQKKYDLSDKFIVICVILAILFMIINLIAFIKKVLLICKKSSIKGDNNESR